jgi:general secretion pathway protein M
MRQAINIKLPRGLLFLMFNASAILFVGLFAVVPVLSHFSERSEEILENAALLSHFRSINRNAQALMTTTEQARDPFLPGAEERVVSADLQANLKTITTAVGARFLGVHGLQIRRPQPLHMVAVSLELEGSLQTIRDVVQTIETQTPFLFITSAELRHAPDADETIIQAELRVQGSMGGDPGAGSTELSAPMKEARAGPASTTARER